MFTNFLKKQLPVSPRTHIDAALRHAFDSVIAPSCSTPLSFSDIHYSTETKSIAEFGDYSVNIAFVLAPICKESPSHIAQEIADSIMESYASTFSSVSVAGGGFINFFFHSSIWDACLSQKTTFAPYTLPFGQKKKVIVEYSSPNIAKPMHVGHLRATLLGEFLSKLYTYTEHTVVRWNHLGDWGTQFGKLIVAYKNWGDKHLIEKNPIPELLALYVRFHDEAKTNPSLEDSARQEFKKLEDGDSANRTIWKYIVNVSLKEFNALYKLFSITFDAVIGESFYEPFLQPFLETTKRNHQAILSEGAWIIPLGEDLPPALVQKGDGATLYITRDIVSLQYRIKKIHPTKVIYVVGNEQVLHFKQLFSVADRLTITTIPLEHCSFGIVFDEHGEKFSTREGRVATANSLITESISKAHEVVKEKQPTLSPTAQAHIAKTIGIGALSYNFLKDNRTSDIIFNPTIMLSFSGNSSSYIQYSYARISSVLRKAQFGKDINPSLLEDADRTIIKTCIRFPEVIQACLTASSAHHLAEFTYRLATELNSLYETTPILSDTNVVRRNTRILLISQAREVLGKSLALLGITPLDRM